MSKIYYKGKVEHSVNNLEETIKQLSEELYLYRSGRKQRNISNDINWSAINELEPPFDKKILTWNENEPDEPLRTDTLVAIERNSKGKLYKWLENGYPTHWRYLPKPPRV